MPKCHICNNDLSDMRWNKLHQEFDPCNTCLVAISEVFGGEAPDDDESQPEPTLEELMEADDFP